MGGHLDSVIQAAMIVSRWRWMTSAPTPASSRGAWSSDRSASATAGTGPWSSRTRPSPGEGMERLPPVRRLQPGSGPAQVPGVRDLPRRAILLQDKNLSVLHDVPGRGPGCDPGRHPASGSLQARGDRIPAVDEHPGSRAP
jgi:hypothetical protein